MDTDGEGDKDVVGDIDPVAIKRDSKGEGEGGEEKEVVPEGQAVKVCTKDPVKSRLPIVVPVGGIPV